MNKIEIEYEDSKGIDFSKRSTDWRCSMLGGDVTYIPLDGYVPSRFVRFCMRLCFGFKWENVKEKQRSNLRK